MRISMLFLISTLIACQTTTTEQTTQSSDFRMAKIDIHSHYLYDSDFLVPLLKEWNMQTLLVDVAKVDSTGNHRYWTEIKAQQTLHPDHFFLCTGFNAFGIDNVDFAEKIITQLTTEIAAGAIMVKVWKNIGMVDKDGQGNFVQIDDPRFQPIWDFLIEKDIPVLAHIGEPLQAWRPLEEGNPHYNYFASHPQYHAYHHPEIPRYETIMAARDNWLARNPGLTVVGAHMGSMSHDVSEIAKRLDKFPNFYVEPAARFGDLTRQDTEKVGRFFIKYQDRILYGTDFGNSEPTENESTETQAAKLSDLKKMHELHLAYFSGSDSLYFDSPMISFPVNTRSLALPDSVLQKFFFRNAEKVLKLQ